MDLKYHIPNINLTWYQVLSKNIYTSYNGIKLHQIVIWEDI